jgi:hypothetical protein
MFLILKDVFGRRSVPDDQCYASLRGYGSLLLFIIAAE